MVNSDQMKARKIKFAHFGALLVATAIVSCCVVPGLAQALPAKNAQKSTGPDAANRVALNRTNRVDAHGSLSRDQSVCPPGHPLRKSLDVAYEAWERMATIRDYTCRFVKRERIDGTLLRHEFMFLKVRNEPFSVYLYALGPSRVRGDEAIYVEGRNNGSVLAHTSGIRDRIAGTIELSPTSPRLMADNIYPLTNIGIQNLLRKLIGFQEYESRYGECEVAIFPEVRVDGRGCRCVQVVHPVPRRNFKFHLIRTYYDHEYHIPIRFEAFSWPRESGGNPVLVEEYSYVNLKLNQNLTDVDFDPNNRQYGFH